VFFQEEEIRIRPALESALKHAQERARVVSALKLVEELSKGLLIQSLESLSRLVMAPSYWCTPLLVSARLPENGRFFLFGARPEDTTLVPGDWVPETLVRMMKAAGEPTRMRILRRLAHEPMTSSQLARLLRLRVPTVLHHLHELRLAGLIQIRLMEGDEKTYTIRKETVDGMVKSFREFLDISAEDSE
jgi:DNA-binding transcriptional ArsR family regulator